MRVLGYDRENGEKVFDMELPEHVKVLPGCLSYQGRHYRYYGYGPPKHIYLETPCEELTDYGRGTD